MECPQCKSDNTQRLSVIYQSGTQQIQTRSRTYGGVGGSGFGLGGATTNTSGTQQSYLAQLAAPPKKKPLAVAVLLVLAGIGCCMYVHALLGVALIGTGAFLGYKAFTFNRDEYPGQYAIWQKSWHCNKCGATYEQ